MRRIVLFLSPRTTHLMEQDIGWYDVQDVHWRCSPHWKSYTGKSIDWGPESEIADLKVGHDLVYIDFYLILL